MNAASAPDQAGLWQAPEELVTITRKRFASHNMTHEPLTPPDCDLRDFPFMPLDVVRLRDSDIAALSDGEEFRCAVLLWCAAWHQVPAASIPDDDVILSQLAGFGRVVSEWQKVREGALRGWVKCSDGRLYHPVVAEKAKEAWESKRQYRIKKEEARIRKAELRARKKQQEVPDYPDLSYGQSEMSRGQNNLSQRQDFEKNKKLKVLELSTTPETNLSTGKTWSHGPLSVFRETDGNVCKTNVNVPETTPECPVENVLIETGKGTDKGIDTHKNLLFSQSLPEVSVSSDERMKKKEEDTRRVTEVALLLRKNRVKPMTVFHPLAIAWGIDKRVTDEVLQHALQLASAYKPSGNISPNYLKPIIDELVNPVALAKQREPPDNWWLSKAGIDRKGGELGLQARPMESYPDYKTRIFDELRKRKSVK